MKFKINGDQFSFCLPCLSLQRRGGVLDGACAYMGAPHGTGWTQGRQRKTAGL